jgi:preflagellin peptidase FlaK
METIPLILGVLAGILTSYTDLKTGFIFDSHAFPSLTLLGKLLGWEEEEDEEVDLPSWIGKIVIPAAEIGVLYYAYIGISRGDVLLALSGLIGLIVGFLAGLLLYYIGAWASGDVVVLAAFSALLPFAPSTAKVVPPYGQNLPLYPLAVLFNSILAVFPFILLYAIGVLISRGKGSELRDVFFGGVRETVEFWLWLMALLGLQAILGRPVLSLILAIILLAVFTRFHVLGDVAGVAGVAFLLYIDPSAALATAWKIFVLVYILKVLLSTVRYMRIEVLMEEVPLEKLREWDILGETVSEVDGEIIRDREDGLERFKRVLMTWDFSSLRPKRGRVIASPTAEGLKREQLEELKRLVEEGKLENRFMRKKAMPFAPALFLGFLIAYFWGDVFWWLVLKVAGL